MESKDFTMIYEEPSTLFDGGPWLAFRDQMLREVELHPDWPEPIEALNGANEHLAWIKTHAPKPVPA